MNARIVISTAVSCLASLSMSISAQTLDPRYTNTAAQMSAIITNQMALDKMVGLGLALVESNTTVWAQGFGWADRELNRPVTTGTVFRIGSVSKVFATTTAMKLWEQGLLDLDAAVTNYIPDFATLPRFTNAPPITVRMLLDHQSGLPGDINPGVFTVEPNYDSLAWLLAYLRTDYPSYPPLTIAVYCNTGFSVWEAIVRAITGLPFTDYARMSIFEPLDMRHSSFLNDHPNISNNMARAYINGERMPDEYINGYATGGMYASMPDLIRYLRMLNGAGMLDGTRYFTTNALAEMTTDTAPNCPMNLMSPGMSGLGWDFVSWNELDYAGRAWIKSGGTLACTAYIIALPDQDLAVAVAANSRTDNLMQIAVQTLRWAVLDKTAGALHWPTNTFVPPHSPVTNCPPAELQELGGYYVTGVNLDQITAADGCLTWISKIDTETPLAYSNLVPRVNGWFSTPDSQAIEITFTNVSGARLMLRRAVQGAYQNTYLHAQRYQPETISAAWHQRIGKLFLWDDLHPLDYIKQLVDNYSLQLSTRHGFLHQDAEMGSVYLNPMDDQTAFVLGAQNRGPAALHVTRTHDAERLSFGGYHFIDASNRPIIHPGVNSTGTISDLARTDWYRLPIRAGVDYRLSLDYHAGSMAVLCDSAAKLVAYARPDDPGCWRANTNGTAYIGVCGDGHTGGAYTVSVTVVNHGGHDFDGDGLADPAGMNGAYLTGWLSSQNYLTSTLYLGNTGRAVLAADVDGDGKADPCVIQTDGAWKIWLSAQNYAATITIPLGTTTGTPLLADVDGDGRADPALIVGATWYYMLSTENYRHIHQFRPGLGAGHPILADFDGDGKADPAMLNGTVWTALLSGQNYARVIAVFNQPGIPCPGDYDGDGLADPAVYNNGWHAWLSGSAYQRVGPLFNTPPVTAVP